MTTQLVKWEAARQALAEARSVDEIKQIKDTADAYRAAARIAKNRELEADAMEIRFRAERRLGEIIAAEKAAGRLSKGNAGKGRPKKGGVSKTPPIDSPPTLDEAGIDKELAKRARKAADYKAPEFETLMDRLQRRAKENDGHLTVSIERLSTEPRRRMKGVGRGKDRMVWGEATTKLKLTAGKVDLVIDQLLRLKPEAESSQVVETIALLGHMQDRLIEWYSEFDPSVAERFQTLTDTAQDAKRRPRRAEKRAATDTQAEELRA